MTSQRKRAIGLATGGVLFLAGFLYIAGGMSLLNVTLAVGGLALIVGLLVLAIWLQERNDAKHARANLARIRAAEADRAQRAKWERALS